MSKDSKLIEKIKTWSILEIECGTKGIIDSECLNNNDDLRRRMASAWVVLRMIDPKHELVKQRLHRHIYPQPIEN